MTHNKVILIGGAPGAGKTTLGQALAVKLGVTSLTIDDLVTAVIAVTTRESHPGIHALRKGPHTDYFTNSSVNELIADATLRHEGSWPMVRQLIQKYTKQKRGIVIDGWHMRPEWVADLQLENVWAGWLVIDPDVLEARERKNEAWLEGSADPERMFTNFMGRSLWYNSLIEEQAKALQMNILYQDGTKSVEELCQLVLANLE
ncbi:MAG: zeta toxin family protein [Ardenticatenaceae bacterium]|nr:zeta toxin family protein [Ardenticatenaceae bacterium]MCB8949938.1 zeta toxin family protein [Ardenticatenaceae bacterium]